MSTASAIDHTAARDPQPRLAPGRLAVVRAGLALLWAALLVVAIGGDTLRTDADVPVAAALLLASYPAIDAVASLLGAANEQAAGRVLRVNAVISTVAVLAIGAAAFGVDAGTTMGTFGAWALISGAIQLGVAIRRRSQGRQLPMIISGGLSTLAGLGFIAGASMDTAHLVNLAGYMALGAVLFIVWAVIRR